MATYKDLADSFRAYEDAKDRHYFALRREAHFLAQRFIERLELGDRTWTTNTGAERQYVSVGHLSNGTFSVLDSKDLPVAPEVRGIRFAISVVLERASGAMPKTQAVVEVEVTQGSNGLLVSILPGGTAMRVPANGYADRFDQVVEAIGQKIISMYNPGDFPGAQVYR